MAVQKEHADSVFGGKGGRGHCRSRFEQPEPKGVVCIFCGAGNNGADGLSAALLLAKTRKVSGLYLLMSTGD